MYVLNKNKVMADFCTRDSKRVVVPMTQQSFYKDPKKVRDETNVIKTKWGYVVEPVSKLVGLPADIIYAFIKIESNGDPKAIGGGISYGLMQINLDTATSVFFRELNNKRLTNGEYNYLKLGLRKAGSNPNKIDLANLKKDKKGNYIKVPNFFSKKEVLTPEINVLLASMFVKELIDITHDADNRARMDKVITIYNTGFKTQQMAKKFQGSTDQLIARVPDITKRYIKKFVGKNGIIDSVSVNKILVI